MDLDSADRKGSNVVCGGELRLWWWWWWWLLLLLGMLGRNPCVGDASSNDNSVVMLTSRHTVLILGPEWFVLITLARFLLQCGTAWKTEHLPPAGEQPSALTTAGDIIDTSDLGCNLVASSILAC
eukprot:scaffold5479_cov199-Amphora_coffeaeformis.AAC.81